MKFTLDKKAKSVIAVYGILAFVYILLFLVIPFPKTASSWISFLFTLIALAGSLAVCGLAFANKETLVSNVYGFPVFRVGALYAIAQLILGALICAISAFVAVPVWITVLLSVLLLAAAAIGVIATDNVRDIVEEADEKLAQETKAVTYFRVDVDGIVDICDNAEAKPALVKLAEQFKYSDPVTGDATKDIEDTLQAMLAELKTQVISGDTEAILGLVKNISLTLNERNRLCKAGK